jgi:hypothetical protein
LTTLSVFIRFFCMDILLPVFKILAIKQKLPSSSVFTFVALFSL